MTMQSRRIRSALIASLLAGFTAVASAQNRPVTQYYYDANGNLTMAVDGLNRPTTQEYDALNRLRRITQPVPAAMQPNPVIQLEVNARDDLTRVTDPRSLATVYTVNGFGEATTQLSPDTGSTIRTFDAAGNLKTSTDARGKITTFFYDGINRVNRVKYGDNTNTYYYYDEGVNGIGRLTRMVDPGSVTTVWTYTPQGRVATRTQTVGSGTSARTHTLGYTYNPTTGQLASLTYPSGRIVTYVYGAGSKDIESVHLDGMPVASGIVWHPLGDVKQMTLGNGQAWATTLDQDGRLTSYTLGGFVHTVVWDAANRIVAINHGSNPSLNQTFGYDNLDRITGFASTGRNQSFNYDLTGNLTARFDDVGGTPSNYTYTIDPTSNRMTAIASMGIGFTIDAVGNRTNDGRIGYLYNARGRLYRVTVTNAAVTQTFNYLINGLNQRVRKTGPSSVIPQGTRIFVYDDAGLLLGEYDNLGRARTEHVWLSRRPIAAVTYTYVSSNLTPATTTVSYVETDHLGTPRLVTNASRQARWSWVSAPYGDTLANENPTALGAYPYNLRFAGQYFDKETNHHYNWHRDYESTTGRYVQSDPIGLAGGVNTYAYAETQPTRLADFLGLATYVCTRPLGARPEDWWKLWPLNHTYLCVGSASGEMTCGGQGYVSEGGSIFAPGRRGRATTPQEDYYNQDACDQRWGEDTCIEGCIRNRLTDPSRPWYAIGPFGTDCQEFAWRLLKVCERQCARR
jgi:RHS repeat-associated protein